MEQDNNELLSPQEREVKNILTKATKEILQIEEQINRLPLAKGQPKPEPKPDGTKSPVSRSKQEIEAELRQQQQAIKTAACEAVEKIADTMGDEYGTKIRMELDEWENPEWYSLSFEQRKKEEKDNITDSQHLALEWLGIEKLDKQNDAEPEITSLDEKVMSVSLSFEMELKPPSFLSMLEKESEKSDKAKEMDKE